MRTPAETLDGKSLDIAGEKSDRLRELFPEVWSEGKIDFNRLKAVLGETVYAGEERYGISWAGKYDAFREIQKQTTATLIPDRAESVGFDASQNIFIEGENLEVLRVLQKAYYGKVKMIYIDPPYNTGSDSFVYPDDYAERREEYEKRAGIRGESGFLNKQDLWKKNTKENGQFHSVWLSMMYPRLYLARNLLREDGVIFVSIDDNEQANLKLLMDEVFGGENYIASFIWKRRQNVDSRSKNGASIDHEFVITYSKSPYGRIRGGEKDMEKYSNPDNDPRGDWMSADMTGLATRDQRPNLHYDVVDPETGINYGCPVTGWRYEPKRMAELIENKEVIFPKNSTGRPRRKKFRSDLISEFTGKSSILNTVFNTQATRELRELFDGADYFDFPKPVSLIKSLIGQSDSSEKGTIILDFFAGSCTTAHAVLDLNREDGGNRRFLCVQMPEALEETSEAYKAGYHTIADIGRARIKKVIEKIKSDKNGVLDLEEGRQDLGFKAYKLQYSNFKVWRSDVEDAEGILKQLEAFRNPLADGVADDREAILTEILLKAGIPLSASVETVDTGAGAVFTVEDGRLWVALEQITPALLAAAVEAKPQTFVCLGTLFQGENADEMMSNAMLELKEAGIEFKVI